MYQAGPLRSTYALAESDRLLLSAEAEKAGWLGMQTLAKQLIKEHAHNRKRRSIIGDAVLPPNVVCSKGRYFFYKKVIQKKIFCGPNRLIAAQAAEDAKLLSAVLDETDTKISQKFIDLLIQLGGREAAQGTRDEMNLESDDESLHDESDDSLPSDQNESINFAEYVLKRARLH